MLACAHLYSKIAKWAVAALTCAILTVLCIAFVDHRVAELTFNRYLSFRTDQLLDLVPRAVSLTMVIGTLLVLVLIISPGGRKRRFAVVARGSLSLAFSYCLVSRVLKPSFGRSGPLPWIWHRVDHFMLWSWGSGPYYFPSGHAALIAAVSATLWLSVPNCRAFAVLMGLTGCALLVALDLHFVSDVVAGSFIGAFVATCVHGLWQYSVRQGGDMRMNR